MRVRYFVLLGLVAAMCASSLGSHALDPSAELSSQPRTGEAGLLAGVEDCDDNGVPDEEQVEPQFVEHFLGGTASVAAGDLDGDGDPDLINGLSDGFGWRENLDGEGSFGPTTQLAGTTPSYPFVAAIDFDDDGDLDVMGNYNDTYEWVENLGGGAFGPLRPFLHGAGFRCDAGTPDLDSDDDADILMATRQRGTVLLTVAWFENDTGIEFPRGASEPIPGNGDAPSLSGADLDGDGDRDVLYGSAVEGWVAWMENSDGEGTLSPLIPFALEVDASDVEAADIDGDGDNDALIVEYPSGQISWYSNDGAGGFGTARIVGGVTPSDDIAYPITCTDRALVHATDLDADGDLDIVSSTFIEAEILWFENLDGAGEFGPPRVIPTIGKPSALLSVDVDGDGDVDLLTEYAWFENLSNDCNGNGLPDSCDAGSTSLDCDGNGVPDECQADCNGNGVADACDIAGATSADCDGNGVPDECQMDCNGNAIADRCDIDGGFSNDCDSSDAGPNGIPDECEPDCNGNDQPDACDIYSGFSADCSGNGVPDVCEPDCNGNAIADDCDIRGGAESDCNDDDVPDSCEADCDANAVPDDCDTLVSLSPHVLTNNDVSRVFSADVDADGTPELLEGRDVYWNTGGGASFDRQDYGLHIVDAADFDGNGFPDLLQWDSLEDRLVLRPNPDGNLAEAPLKVVAEGYAAQPYGIGADVDGDGDTDVIVSSSAALAWFENLDGQGLFGPATAIRGAVGTQLYAVDIDGDDDLDILASGDVAAWLENLDGLGAFGAPHEITGVDVAVWPADLDGDTDVDVLVADNVFCGAIEVGCSSEFRWYPNLDGSGQFGPPVYIHLSSINARYISAADMDGDGDLDALSATSFTPGTFREGEFRWHENDGTGAFSAGGLIYKTEYNQPDEDFHRILGVDIDADGDQDIVTSTSTPGSTPLPALIWYENGGDDCNGNGAPDSCDAAVTDCDLDGVPDECPVFDCNDNGQPDACDVGPGGSSLDCTGNGVPDECESDCNGNGTADSCDILSGTDDDCNDNGVPDSCEAGDCNDNGVRDTCDLADQTSADCNFNGVPDECDALSGDSEDCTGDLVPDECDPDCNDNGEPDTCDVGSGFSPDCNGNLVPDECDTAVDFTEVLIVDGQATRSGELSVGDVTGNGAADLLTAETSLDRIRLFRNTQGSGPVTPGAGVANDLDYATSVFAADLDGDDDLDMLATAWQGNEFLWYENLPGDFSFGPKQIIGTAEEARRIRAADVDGDGDQDVIAAATGASSRVAWFENLVGAGTFGDEQLISTLSEPRWPTLVDLDGDGDPDLLIGYRTADVDVAWHENLDGLGDFGPEQVIDGDLPEVNEVAAADVDGDGDMDVFAAGDRNFADPDSGLSWYENLDGAGNFGSQFVIDTSSAGVRLADLDNDGDVDVVHYSIFGSVRWSENLDGLGTFGPTSSLVSASAPQPIFTADADGDGDADIFYEPASTSLRWLRNEITDCNGNGVPDSCETDCNENGVPDSCDLQGGLSVDCNGDQVPDECETICVVGCDADGDGCIDDVDSDDADPLICGDVDNDGCDDCSSGHFAPHDDGTNSDSDGVCNVGDCDPGNNRAWSAPGAVATVQLSRNGNDVSLQWVPPMDPGGFDLRYDALRSDAASDFVGAATCIGTNEAATNLGESEPITPGQIRYFLIRVENDCPDGATLAPGSDGSTRPALPCD